MKTGLDWRSVTPGDIIQYDYTEDTSDLKNNPYYPLIAEVTKKDGENLYIRDLVVVRGDPDAIDQDEWILNVVADLPTISPLSFILTDIIFKRPTALGLVKTKFPEYFL